MTSRLTLVVNPSSGKGRALELLPQVAGRIRDAGHDLDILLSRDFAEARAMTEDVVASEADVLVVMGGDGMMHLGINACARRATGDQLGAATVQATHTTLGMIPAGTGNDFCRGVGVDPKNPLAAAETIARGHVREIDLALVGDRYVGAVLATGFDALVNRRANAMPWPQGSLRYPLATLAEIRVFAPLHYRLVIDGAVRELEAMLVAVGNTSSYGGGMHICPDADPTDGLLDVTVIHPVGAAKLLRMLPLMYSGRFARDRSVERLQAERIVIEGPGLVGFGDGELIGATPLTVSSAPKSLRVLVPDRVPWGHHGQRDLRPRRRAEPGTGLRPVPQQPDESGGQGLR